MKIVSLRAENFKRIVAVEITPTGNMVELTGKNGQGKTSVLDAIWAALGGGNAAPEMPIRTGAAEATIRIDLGEIVVYRAFRPSRDGSTVAGSIKIENAEGMRAQSPQALLDKMLGSLTFDPLAFSRMGAKEQFNMLRQFVPGVDFDKIDADNKLDYEKRTIANRLAKERRSVAAAIAVDQPFANTPLVDEAAIVEQLANSGVTNNDISLRRQNRERLAAEATTQAADAARQRGEAAELAERARVLVEQAGELEKKARETQSKLAAAPALAPLVDTTALSAQLNSARAYNAKINDAKAKLQERDRCNEEAVGYESQATHLTESMDLREAQKREAITSAALPVPGIGFGENSITLAGVPFSQASDAEQLRASIAMAMAMNPKLRVLRVRDGSLLDSDSMKLLGEMADKNDFQVWIERVEGDGKTGVVIEDGHVRPADPAPTMVVPTDEHPLN